MANIVREIDYADMEKSCKGDAKERFKRPAYSGIELSEKARELIRAQGRQMDRQEKEGDHIARSRITKHDERETISLSEQ